VECRCGDRIRGQGCVRLTDRTVGLSSVMPNETFSRRHDVLPSSSELDLQMSTAQKRHRCRCGTNGPRPTGRGIVRHADQN
jgi:hypothetical protein